MATKIRLARHGHKDYAYYHIVVADSRSPRDRSEEHTSELQSL